MSGFELPPIDSDWWDWSREPEAPGPEGFESNEDFVRRGLGFFDLPLDGPANHSDTPLDRPINHIESPVDAASGLPIGRRSHRPAPPKPADISGERIEIGVELEPAGPEYPDDFNAPVPDDWEKQRR